MEAYEMRIAIAFAKYIRENDWRIEVGFPNSLSKYVIENNEQVKVQKTYIELYNEFKKERWQKSLI